MATRRDMQATMTSVVNDENGGAKQNALPVASKKRNFTELMDKVEKSENDQSQSNTVDIGAVQPGKKRRPGRRWTQHEDSVLRKLVEKNGNRHWKKIAKEFFELSGSERSDVQCLHRWNKCLKPGLVKGPWSPEEDTKILQMIEESGGPQNVRWSVIAKSLNGRLGKQVRERFINHLDPTISKAEWTPAEDRQLYELHKRLGNRWKWIAELMPGRSENGVKNRWHSIKPNFAGGDKGSGDVKKEADAVAVAGKTAAAAAVAAAVANASKKSKKSAATKKKRAPSRGTKKAKDVKPVETSASLLAGSLSSLLSAGSSLLASSSPSGSSSSSSPSGSDMPMDLSAVAERAKELLRMSESYREMAKLMLSQQQSKPASPQFNELLQREISNQIAKQLGSTGAPSVITQFQGPGNNTGSPLATDPLLFSNYFNIFSNSMGGLSQSAASTPNLGQASPSFGSGKAMSPHQLLAAAAAAAQFSASEAKEV